VHFINDIKVEEPLGEQRAELPDLHRKESFDYCEICKKAFSRNNNTLGHESTSSRDILSRCEMCLTLFNHRRNAVKVLRGRERRFSCDVC
jgi:hypothetical protein